MIYKSPLKVDEPGAQLPDFTKYRIGNAIYYHVSPITGSSNPKRYVGKIIEIHEDQDPKFVTFTLTPLDPKYLNPEFYEIVIEDIRLTKDVLDALKIPSSQLDLIPEDLRPNHLHTFQNICEFETGQLIPLDGLTTWSEYPGVDLHHISNKDN